MDIGGGGGDGVNELIDCCVIKICKLSFSPDCWDFGESGGSLMQIDAC